MAQLDNCFGREKKNVWFSERSGELLCGTSEWKLVSVVSRLMVDKDFCCGMQWTKYIILQSGISNNESLRYKTEK